MMWFYYALASVAFFTGLNLLQRTVAMDSKNPRVMAIVFNSLAALVAIIIFILTGGFTNFRLPHSPFAYLSLAGAVLFYGLFERGRFHAAQLLDASIFSTITNVSVVVAFIASFIFYKESFSLPKIIGGLLIITALFLISYEKKRHSISQKGLAIAVGISIALGLGWALDKYNSTLFSATTYNILVWTLPIPFLIFPGVTMSQIKSESTGKFWKLGISAALNVCGYLFQLKALSLTEATKVIPVIQTSLLFTILLGIVFLKERDNIPKKILAGVLAFIGVYLLV